MARRASQRTAQEKALPYLCNLPGDEEVIQILAFSFALEAGYAASSSHTTLSPLGIAAMTIDGMQRYLAVIVDGKQGTNDQAAFFAIFQPIVTRVYVAMLALLSREPWLASHLRTCKDPTALTTECHRAAMANLPALLATPADCPVAITWPRPRKKQEMR